MASAIAIKIDEALLRDVHVRATERGLSMQQYLNSLIERDLFPERFPKLEAHHLETIREAAHRIGADIQPVLAVLESNENQKPVPPSIESGGGMEMIL